MRLYMGRMYGNQAGTGANKMFSKRHYEAIALVMQEAREDYPNVHAPEHWLKIVRRLGDLFARDNAAFNHDRFIAACEPGANVRARTAYLKPAKVTP